MVAEVPVSASGYESLTRTLKICPVSTSMQGLGEMPSLALIDLARAVSNGQGCLLGGSSWKFEHVFLVVFRFFNRSRFAVPIDTIYKRWLVSKTGSRESFYFMKCLQC